MMRKLFCLSLLAIAFIPSKIARAADSPPVSIFIGASTREAVEEVAADFTKQTGIEVKVVPGGSNTLAMQIINGAPADLFLSASADWANEVQKHGLAEKSHTLLTNTLVLVVPKDNPSNIKQPSDLATSAVKKLALAGENVPAGKYAQQALTKAGVYDALVEQRKIARGSDVRVALGYVEAGEAEAGIVYATDAQLSKKVSVAHTFEPNSHDAIEYPLVLLKAAEKHAGAAQFYEYLGSKDAQKVFMKFGFGVAVAPAGK